jgi:hypothetical protein
MSTCFVIQGFGKKTDYTDGRVLNLDASYEVIKQGVVAAGLECIRADEIQHSTVIDVPMYEMLLQADVVIADLSTYNVNAAYELGVRYALRPRTTIVVAEEGFKNPFDFGHIALRRYKHSGDDIGFGEAMRFINELKTAIQEILSSNRSDSPVTYLPQLAPPKMPVQAPPPPAPPPAFAAPPMPRGGPVDFAAPAASPPGFDHALAAAPGLEMAAPPSRWPRPRKCSTKRWP